MAKLAEFPIQWCYTCSPSAFHSPPQIRRNALANNTVPSPHLGIHSRGRMGRQVIQPKNKFWERSIICCYSWSLVVCTRKLSRGITRWAGRGRLGSVHNFGSQCHGAFSPERLGTEVRSSSKAARQNEDGRIAQEAREAVLKVLLEAGLSQGDSETVVSKAPVFISELVGCIQDLEDTDPLVSEDGSHVSEDVGDRIYQLANHSRGMSPFLESLGVQLPNVSRIAYSFSSQLLPELLSKVRFFEELLTKTKPRDRPLDGLIQFMVKNLSVSVWEDEDIQRTLSFFEKVKRKEGGLGALEETNSALPLLIEAFPQIFKRSLEHQIKPILRFLEGLGIEGDNLGKVISCYPSILLQDPEKDLLPRKRTLKKVGIRVEDMGRMIAKYPWLLSKCVGSNVDVLVQFLESIKATSKRNGHCFEALQCYYAQDLHWKMKSITFGTVQKRQTVLPATQFVLDDNFSGNKTILHIIKLIFPLLFQVPKSKIDRSITRSPHLLGCSSTDALKPMVQHIKGYGLQSRGLGRAVAQSPELLLHTPQEFDAVVSFLESVGVEASDISKLLRRSPEILGSSIESTLQKKVIFLEDLGVRRKKLGRIITFFPEILSMSVESALMPRVKYLREWGFAKNEICRMAFKFPPLLGYDPEAVLRPKLEFLTTTMNKSVKDVVPYPRYFSHSLEKKIKPRARVLANRQIQCDLKTMLAKNNDQFAEEFLGFESILIPPMK